MGRDREIRQSPAHKLLKCKPIYVQKHAKQAAPSRIIQGEAKRCHIEAEQDPPDLSFYRANDLNIASQDADLIQMCYVLEGRRTGQLNVQ